eukprot:COSAG02_NODE_7347_length_3053_cov_4.215978_1_plen_121_part_00
MRGAAPAFVGGVTNTPALYATRLFFQLVFVVQIRLLGVLFVLFAGLSTFGPIRLAVDSGSAVLILDHTGFLSVAKVPRFQNHRPRAIPHRHSTWVHEYDLHAYGIPVQMIPGLWNEIIGD